MTTPTEIFTLYSNSTQSDSVADRLTYRQKHNRSRLFAPTVSRLLYSIFYLETRPKLPYHNGFRLFLSCLIERCQWTHKHDGSDALKEMDPLTTFSLLTANVDEPRYMMMSSMTSTISSYRMVWRRKSNEISWTPKVVCLMWIRSSVLGV